MPVDQDLGIVLLAAGASRRMGRPKLLLPWGQTTVIGHLITQWRSLGAGQLTIVLRPDDHALATELDRLSVPPSDRISNPDPERGMYSSIHCAATWSGWRKEISRWAIVLGDQPHLKPETLRTFLDFAAQHPEAICQPQFGQRTVHPVILPKSVFSVLTQSPATNLKEFLAQTKVPHATLPFADPGLTLDLDTPKDYQRLHPRG